MTDADPAPPAVRPEVHPDAQRYLDDMVARRGYVLDYHKVMAAQDFPVLKAADDLVTAAYLAPRRLSAQTKELLFILSLTVLRSQPSHIASHIRVALRLGVTPEEILEALEIALPEAGVVAFQHGFDVWRDEVGAAGLEPTPTDG
jgi:4-carboxymuconolactone decarboxylase